ncbi:NAD(P)-dependent oxidoreductase [Phenylobacterium sp.]|uniref:NAD(P)-dependent oxidoreductase n=1 Tax=Phenylobacterium sp. TaxID=1871053 RepID=UPI0025D3A55B|nr:NAD(P)H-binding protein [Phenylobacterium sp.]MCA6342050.1 NAD(P)H-binding protein [Phenylobacterium sp.]
MKIAVLGANGLTGEHVVETALGRGHDVVAVVRDRNRLRQRPKVQVQVADVFDPVQLKDALQGADAVIVALGINRSSRSPIGSRLISPPDTCTRAVTALTTALRDRPDVRIVYMSSAGANKTWLKYPAWARMMIQMTQIKWSMRDHTGAEKVLESNKNRWSIVQPATLDDNEPTKAARLLRSNDKVLSKVSRVGVASFLVNCAEDTSSKNQFFEITGGA